MSEFNSRLEWKRDHPDFELKTLNRSHRIHFPNGALLEGSSAPDYSGDPEKNNPEQLFVASLSSCHMMTFLAVASLNKWLVQTYRDQAQGFLEENQAGRIMMNWVILQPQVVFSGSNHPSSKEQEDMHLKARRSGFIANSVRTSISIQPNF